MLWQRQIIRLINKFLFFLGPIRRWVFCSLSVIYIFFCILNYILSASLQLQRNIWFGLRGRHLVEKLFSVEWWNILYYQEVNGDERIRKEWTCEGMRIQWSKVISSIQFTVYADWCSQVPKYDYNIYIVCSRQQNALIFNQVI